MLRQGSQNSRPPSPRSTKGDEMTIVTVHALRVCPCGCGIRSRCGKGRPLQGTFLYKKAKGKIHVPLTCRICRRLTKGEQ